jgi:hypothetical protein
MCNERGSATPSLFREGIRYTVMPKDLSVVKKTPTLHIQPLVRCPAGSENFTMQYAEYFIPEIAVAV